MNAVRELVISDICVNEIVIKLENLSMGTHIIKITLFDRSHNLVCQEMQVDVVLTTTFAVEQINSYFRLDSRSLSILIFILSIVVIFIAVSKLRAPRRKKS